MNALAAKGHNITVLSTEIDKNPPPNVHYIYMEGVFEYLHQLHEGTLVNMVHSSMWDSLRLVADYSIGVCEGIRRSAGPKVLLSYPDNFKFHVILSDFTCGPCLAGFVHKFNYPPVIAYTGFNNPMYTVDIVGGHNSFAYKPYHTTKFSNRMSFWQRAVNMFYFAMEC